MKKFSVVVALLVAFVASAPVAQAEDYTLGVALQGLLDPHIVGGASYNTDTKTWAAVLTANVVGVKLGSLPCYASGLGVSLNTIAPGLEDAPIAAASLPLLTCAPFGEQVVVQTGISVPLNGGPTSSKSYYAGLGISVSGGPNMLKAKRVARIKAKEKKALLDLQDEAQGRQSAP